ncbi:MAG: zinc ribbon domain-containing protein [Nitrososphaerales archaeon]
MRTISYRGWFLISSVLLIFWSVLFAAVNLVFLLFLPLIGFWYVLGKKLSRRSLLTYILSAEIKFHNFRLRRKKENEDEHMYFLQDEDRPSVLQRTLGIIIAVLGSSLWLVTNFPELQITSNNIGLSAAVLSFVAFPVVPLLLYPLWVYEDSGLRVYHQNSGEIGTPGALIRGILTTTSVILAVITLVPTAITEPGSGLSNFVLYLIVLLLVVSIPSFFVAVLFTYKLEPDLISKFKKTELVGNFHSASVSLSIANAFKVENNSKCVKCGADLKEGAIFCSECGIKAE